MNKLSYLIILIVLLLGFGFSIYQYSETFKTEIVSATSTVPNPGHTWASMECNSDSLCLVGNNLGMGTASPSNKLHIIGTMQSDLENSVVLPQLYLRRLISGVFDGTSFSVDVGMGMGQSNLVGGASLSSLGYTYNGTRGA